MVYGLSIEVHIRCISKAYFIQAAWIHRELTTSKVIPHPLHRRHPKRLHITADVCTVVPGSIAMLLGDYLHSARCRMSQTAAHRRFQAPWGIGTRHCWMKGTGSRGHCQTDRHLSPSALIRPQ